MSESETKNAPRGSAQAAPQEPGAHTTDESGPRPARRSRRSAYATRDLTTGSIPRTLWFLAWPQYLEASLQIVDQIFDLILAGLLGGFKAIAGIGAAQQYAMTSFTLRQGIDMAMRAMVSRAIGMGDSALANHVVLQGLALTVAYSIIIAIVGVLLTEPLLRALGLSEDVIELGTAYMRLQFIGQAFAGFQSLSSNALAAAGDTMTPMRAGIIARATKIALSPVLMFGLLWAPSWGLAGAAVATILGNTAALAYLTVVLVRGDSRLRLDLRSYRTDWDMQKRMLRLGWPAALNRTERTLTQVLFGFLVAPFGDVAYAAFTVTRRLEGFGHMGVSGIGNAAGTMAGQNIGAGRPDRAKASVLWASVFGVMINGAMGLLIFIFPDFFLVLFAREPEFIEAARPWLMIMLVGFLSLGWASSMDQSFQQAGDPKIVMYVNFVTLWAVVPLAVFLSRATPLAELGVAWAMVAALFARPLAFTPYFLGGRWLRVRLFASEAAAPPKP